MRNNGQAFKAGRKRLNQESGKAGNISFPEKWIPDFLTETSDLLLQR
jgi:hypothetical protein